MSGMDTNSIQPTEQNEVAISNSTEVLSSFEDSFLSTTKALGVWPISLVSGLLVFTLLSLVLSGPEFPLGISNFFFCFLSTVFVWIALSWFRLPTIVKAILSIWACLIIGILPLLTALESVMFRVISIQAMTKLLQILLVYWLIPYFSIGLMAIVPYFLNESFLKTRLLKIGSNALLEKHEDKAQT
jgi:hypothetical protein